MTNRRRLELGWSLHEGRPCLRIRGWTYAEVQALESLGSVEVLRRLCLFPSEVINEGTALDSLQPVLGRFEFVEDEVCFLPRFPFTEGIRYSLLVGTDPEGWRTGRVQRWEIELPRLDDLPSTEVLSIYPSGTEVPVNQLKIYVQFSAPMSEGCASWAVTCRRADGRLMEGVFLPFEPELWDRRRQRLTLLLDPGRTKRGLAPNLQAGYPLTQGVPFVVNIDERFVDAAGRPMRMGASRRYEVGPPVRERVDPARWRFRWPALGSRAPLSIDFDRPLDHALLEHCLWVYDANGMPMAGRSFPGSGEWSWHFEPRAPWEAVRHSVIVDPHLEDLAGNSVVRVFDRDLTRPAEVADEARALGIDFTPAVAG